MRKQPLLSIGMIVKNEIRCLEKCLKALQTLRDAIPCELVIADTGSTDGTREIAEKYADILFDFEWINDFSAARNAVIARCTGKWYMTIDADEYLQPEIDELVVFLNSPDANTVSYCTYIQRNHQKRDMTGEYSDFPALRMARMIPELRYHGEIHEAFTVTEDTVIRALNHIIVDHDGYTDISPEYLRKKAERNMELLERELEKNPTDLWRLLQCVESAAALPEKRHKYAYSAMNLIMGDTEHSRAWAKFAPIIARKAIEITVVDQLPEAEEWLAWARSNFPMSIHVQVDANYAYILKLETEKRYEELAEVGRDYLQGVKRYHEMGPSSPELRASDIFKAHPKRENQARLFIAQAMRETGAHEEAVSVLSGMEFTSDDTDTLRKWMYSLEELQEYPEAAELVAQRLGHLFADGYECSDEEKKQYGTALSRINTVFAPPADHTKSFWRLYRNIPGTIGVCVRLAETNNREQSEKILSEIDNWELFMPLALARAMWLGAELPDAFYHISANRLHELENALPKCDPNFASYVAAYTEPEQITDWHRLCFTFELLATAWMSGPKEDDCDLLAEYFAVVGGAFLREYYNPALLESEAAVGRLPALHRFAWYFAKAMELRRNGDIVGCVRDLRAALAQTEAMKELINYLIGKVSEEQERQTIVANASPELLALAEQVKKILAMYSANDPAVVALKQTPAYQQVAFLIEEPDGAVR